jgi:hypothetical protein
MPATQSAFTWILRVGWGLAQALIFGRLVFYPRTHGHSPVFYPGVFDDWINGTWLICLLGNQIVWFFLLIQDTGKHLTTGLCGEDMEGFEYQEILNTRAIWKHVKHMFWCKVFKGRAGGGQMKSQHWLFWKKLLEGISVPMYFCNLFLCSVHRQTTLLTQCSKPPMLFLNP